MRRRKKKNLVNILFILLVSISLGYAFLMTDLTILGTSKISANSWSVHFDNLNITTESVPLQTGDQAAMIDQTTNTDITYTITLTEPGQFYEFTVDVVNEGTLDAMIGSITSKLGGVEISSTNPLPEYLTYSVTYSDDVPLALNQILEAGDTETYKVRLAFRTDINSSALPGATTTLSLSFGVTYAQADGNATERLQSLYGVLKDAATVGTYAGEYTGSHQDSYTRTNTHKIYHWYADSDASGTAILDKNNVIFAEHCWQMIRTTDTGGVKMIYNGEMENNQCLNTRGNHVGYGGTGSTQTLTSDYYYGTSYTYDETNNVFSLSGTLEHKVWNATNGPTLIGKYTCMQTTQAGTCATLYLIESYNDTTSGNVLSLISTATYSQFGTLQYNATYISPAYVGYMYNPNTLVSYKDNSAATSGSLFGTGVKYSGSFYTLINTSNTYDENHHYTCNNITGTCSTVRYYYYNNYYVELNNGVTIEQAIENMLSSNNINQTNSTIKTGVDAWYVKYLSDYEDYLEDTIFCNNRSIRSLEGWNPNGGSKTIPLQFKEYIEIADLSCPNVTDQFSTLNPLATLTYKVGLMTSSEMNLLNNSNARNAGQTYWLETPFSFGNNYGYVRRSNATGGIGNSSIHNTHGIRPAISLKKGTGYVSGDGTMANPYIVQ